MKQRMKKLLSLALCLVMVMSLLPVTAMATGGTESQAVAATTVDDPSGTTYTDEYGTKLTVPESFDANDGVHPYGSGDADDTTSNLMPVKEVGVYVSGNSSFSSKVYNFTEDTILNGDNGSNSGIFSSQYNYMATSQYFGGSNAPLSTQWTSGDIGELRFAAGVAYDPKGTGRDDHVAYVGATRGDEPQWALYTSNASSNGSFNQAWRDTWNAGLNGTGRIAYEWVKTTTRYDSSGYAAIAAGDFDGDGRDTLVFYDPALSLLDLQEYDENNNGGTSTRIYIDSAHFGNSKTLKELFGQSLDYITLFSELAGLSDSCLNIPMLQMDAGDLDNDGRDELVVTVSLSNLDQENVSPNNYNGDRSSVVMLLEKNGGDWELAWAKQMSDVYVAVAGSYNNTSLNPSGGWYMRAASSRIVDYNNDGTKEIITVGVPSDDNADDDNFVTSGYIGVIISANGAIETTSNTKNGSTSLVGYYFPRDTDGNDDYVGVRDSYLQCLCPTSLGVVRFDGIGTRPYIVVRGIIYQYNGSGFTAAQQGGVKDNMFQNRYIMLQPIVGNFDGNRQGREQILFVLSDGSDNNVEIGGWYYNYTTATGADESALTGTGLRSARWKVNAYGAPDVVLTAPDADANDGMIAEYGGKLYTFADPKILAILEAAPYFEDLKDEYGETLGSTSFSTATSSGSGTTTSSTNSAGAYIAFEQEISVMGLINVGKVESEVAYTAEWTSSVEQSTEWELELSFDAGRETNRVVLFYTPVIIYNYTVTDLSTGEETTMHINSMRKPVYSTLSVEDYNAGAALRGDPLIGEDVVSVVPGQPDSYRRDTSGLTNVVSYGQWVGTNSGSSNITQSISYSTSTTLTKEVTHSVDVKAGAGAGGFVVGGTYGHTWGSGSSTTNTESVTRSGTVADVPSDYADDYRFDWQFITWDTSVTANGKTYTVPVLSYLVRDVEQAPSVPIDLDATADEDSVTLTWESGYKTAIEYEVCRYLDPDNSGQHYYWVGTVNSSNDEDGQYTFTDTGLASATLYQYAVRAVGADGKISRYTEPVSIVTASKGGALPNIVLQPKDKTVLSGSTAEFSVSATAAGGGTLTYAWQVREPGKSAWQRIEGANSKKLSVVATEEMNGTEYRCMVSELSKTGNTVLFVYTDKATLTVDRADSTVQLTASATSGNVAYTRVTSNSSENGQTVKARYKVMIGSTTGYFEKRENTYAGTRGDYPAVYIGEDGVYYLLTNLNVSSEPDSAGVFSGTAGGKTALTAAADMVTIVTETTAEGGTTTTTSSDYPVYAVTQTVEISGTIYEVYTATGIAVKDEGEDTVLSISQLTLYKSGDKYYADLNDGEAYELVEVQKYTGSNTAYLTNENNTYLAGTLAPVAAVENGYTVFKYTHGSGTGLVYQKNGKYYSKTSGESGDTYTELAAMTGLFQSTDGKLVQAGDFEEIPVTETTDHYTQVPGEAVTLTVNVSVDDERASVPGKVTFQLTNTTTGVTTTQDVTVELGSDSMSGTATLTWTPTTAGVYTIVATYGGSTTATVAVSNAVTYYALETKETTTWYDIGFSSAAPRYGDTITPTLYSYTSGSAQGSTVYNVTFTAYKLLSSGYSTTGTTLPAVLVPGEYLVKAEATVDGASVTASKALTVGKCEITVTAPNVNENNTLSIEEAESFSLSSLTPIFSREFVSGDSYPDLFTLTGGPQARSGKYDIRVVYATGSKAFSQKADFLSKYSPTFEISTVIVTTEASFAVTYSAGANGSLSAHGEQYFASNTNILKGSELIFTATPDANYKISKWTVTLNGEEVDLDAAIAAGTIIVSGNSLVITRLSGPLDVRVEFSNEIYQVSFSVDGFGGAIKAEQLGTVLTSPANVTGGSSVIFTAAPETGKVVQRWTVNGTEQKNPDGSTYTGRTLTLDELAENAAVQVRFEDTAAYAVSYSAVDKDDTDKTVAGVDITAWVDDDEIPSGSTAEKGSTVVLTADITPGNAVMEWQASTDGGTNWKTIAEGGNTCTIYSLQADTMIRALTITGAATYSVSFEVVRAEGTAYVVENVGTLTAIYNGKSYTPDDNSHRGQINCTAYTSVGFAYAAPDDWEVVEWLVNGESVQSGLDKLSYSIESLSGGTNVQVVVQKKPQIIFEQPANGTISVSGTVKGFEKVITSGTYVDYGTSVTVTVDPDPTNHNYVVTKIHTEEVNVEKSNGAKSETFDNITTDQTITVVLTEKPTVTIVSDSNGTVAFTGTKNGKTVTNTSTDKHVDFGSNLTVTLRPDKGYVVADTIEADYIDGTGETTDDKTYTISDVQENKTITPVWSALPKYAVTYSVADPGSGTNGTLTASVDRKGLDAYKIENFSGTTDTDEDSKVCAGSVVTFTAEPAEGYRVKEWTVNGVVQKNGSIIDISKTLTLEIPGDVTDKEEFVVTVEFMPVGSLITATAGDNGSIVSAIVGDSEQVDNIGTGITLSKNASVVITAQPDTGYEVECWTVNGVEKDSSTNTFIYTADSESAGAVIIVTFRQVEYTVTWGGTHGTVTASGFDSTPANIRGGTSVTFTAVPDDGYVLTGWTVNGEAVSEETDTTFTWTVPNGKAEDPAVSRYEVRAVFERGKYAVTVTQPDHGTITPKTEELTAVTGDTRVTFTAVPESGYIVIGWKVDDVTTDTRSNTYTVTVTKPITVTAILVPDHYEVTCAADEVDGEAAGGTVTISGSEATSASVAYGGSISFTAAPADYYHVSGWKVDGELQANTANKNTFTLTNVTEPHTVTAVFEAAIRYGVYYEVDGTGGTLSAEYDDGTPLKMTSSEPQPVWGGSNLVFTAAPDNETGSEKMVASWQISTDGGIKWTEITRANLYTLSNIGVDMEHYLSNTLTVTNLRTNLYVKVSFTELKLFEIPGNGPGYTVTVDSRNPENPGDDTQIRENGDVTFTICPNTGSDYFTISQLKINGFDFINGGTNGNVTVVKNADGSYTVTITGVTEAITTDIVAYKVVVDQLKVPDALKSNPDLNTVEKIQTKLETRMSGTSETQVFYDIALKYYNGNDWAEVAEEDFPADGVDVALNYPEGTDSKDIFTIVHMLITSEKAGELEIVSYTKEVNCLHFHVDSLSPFGVSWTKYVGGGGGGGGMPSETVIILDSDNGKITADNTYAQEGDTVTLTVTPDEGYVLEKLTVTDKNGKDVTVTDKDGKYTFIMPDSEVTVEGTFKESGWNMGYIDCPEDNTCPIWPFTDAKTTNWYHDGVHFCLENGLVVGCGDDLFAPNNSTTRAMVTVMLWRINGCPEVNYDMDFEDVAENTWYTEAVRWAAAEGVAQGYGNGKFGPNDIMTREQMVTILWRYAQYKDCDVSVGEDTNILSYGDADSVAEYAIPAMQWACGSGIVNGIQDGSSLILDPKGSATRAQMATMMMRFCTEIEK